MLTDTVVYLSSQESVFQFGQREVLREVHISESRPKSGETCLADFSDGADTKVRRLMPGTSDSGEFEDPVEIADMCLQ